MLSAAGSTQDVTQLDLSVKSPQEIPDLESLLAWTVLSGGKLLRPRVCFLMGRLFGLDSKRLAPYARLAELIHAATLAHDDVVDDAVIRRGRPTLNQKTSNPKAVLAGDILLARVVREAVELGPSEVVVDVTRVLEALSLGEWMQLSARGNLDVTYGSIERISELKTASLLSFCCIVPARIAGLSEDQVERARKFGQALGIAFQMVDDVLDFEPNGEKPFASDLQEGLVNFVTFEILHQSSLARGRIAEALGKPLGASPWEPEDLRRAQETVRHRAGELLSCAHGILDELRGPTQLLSDEARSAEEELRTILDFLALRSR